MRERSCVSGWRRPMAGSRPGSVTSTAPAGRRVEDSAARRSSSADLDVLLELVDLLAERGALVGRGRAQGLHQAGHGAALAAQVLVAQRLQVRVGADGGELGGELGAEVGDGGHGGDVLGAGVPSAECGAEVPSAECRCCVRLARRHAGTQHRTWHAALGTRHRCGAAVRPPLPWSASPARPACRTPPRRARRGRPAACGRARSRRP